MKFQIKRDILLKSLSIAHNVIERKNTLPILSNVLSIKEAPSELIGFQTALALQCFTNEYIYNYTKEEEKTLQLLEASVRKNLENNEQPSPQVILILASYKSLKEYGMTWL